MPHSSTSRCPGCELLSACEPLTLRTVAQLRVCPPLRCAYCGLCRPPLTRTPGAAAVVGNSRHDPTHHQSCCPELRPSTVRTSGLWCLERQKASLNGGQCAISERTVLLAPAAGRWLVRILRPRRSVETGVVAGWSGVRGGACNKMRAGISVNAGSTLGLDDTHGQGRLEEPG